MATGRVWGVFCLFLVAAHASGEPWSSAGTQRGVGEGLLVGELGEVPCATDHPALAGRFFHRRQTDSRQP